MSAPTFDMSAPIDPREIADARRRMLREQAELADLASWYRERQSRFNRVEVSTPDGVDPYLYSRSIRGTPSNHSRDVRASVRHRPTASRAIGTAAYQSADGTWHPILTEEGRPTVLVLNGTEGAVVPASAYRRRRASTLSQRDASETHAADVAARRLALLESAGYATELADGTA